MRPKRKPKLKARVKNANRINFFLPGNKFPTLVVGNILSILKKSERKLDNSNGSEICAAHQIFVDRSWIFTLGIEGNSNFLSF